MNARRCRAALGDVSPIKLQRLAILAGLLAFSTVLAGVTDARACPPGTVFSAYKGNGLCLVKGEGKTVAAKCTTIIKGPCPKDMARKKKASDPDHVYCCPKAPATVTPNCDEQCAPILTSVTPASEADRVCKNCRLGCMGSDKFMSPDGRMIKTGRKC